MSDINKNNNDDKKSGNINLNNNDFKERIAAIKGKQDLSTIKSNTKIKENLTFKQKFFRTLKSNYISIVAGVCVVGVLIALATPNIHSTNYDLEFILVSNYIGGMDLTTFISEPFETVCDDYNKDGKIETCYNSIYSTGKYESNVAQTEAEVLDSIELMEYLSNFKMPLLFVDDINYNKIQNQLGVKFLNLSEISNGKVNDDKLLIGDSILKDKFQSLNSIINKMYVVIVDLNAPEDKDKYLNNEQYMENYNKYLNYLEKLI